MLLAASPLRVFMIAKAWAGSADIGEALKVPDPEPGLTRADLYGIGQRLGRGGKGAVTRYPTS